MKKLHYITGHLNVLHVQTYQIMFAIDNLTVTNTILWHYCCGFGPTIPLMATFDLDCMRIMGHALRIIGAFLGNYR